MPVTLLSAPAAELSPFLESSSLPNIFAIELLSFSSAITEAILPSTFGAKTINSSSSMLAGVNSIVFEIVSSLETTILLIV